MQPHTIKLLTADNSRNVEQIIKPLVVQYACATVSPHVMRCMRQSTLYLSHINSECFEKRRGVTSRSAYIYILIYLKYLSLKDKFRFFL